MDIRRRTCLVCRKNGRYLQGIDPFGELLWTVYKYDAWRTRKKDVGYKLAKKLNAELMLFNPVVGQIKMLEA